MAEYNGQTVKLDSPRVLVIYGNGEVLDVQTEHPDLALYDLERTRKKWPSIQEGPMWWLSYVAYSKIKRDGHLPDPKATFETWLLTVQGIKNLDQDGQIADMVAQADPSPADPVPA